MLHRRRVVVVIHHEYGKILFRDDLCHRRFPLCHAIKAEILIIAVEPPAEHRGIGIAGDACTVTVRDRGTVE